MRDITVRGMRHPIITATFTMVAAACATAPRASLEDRTLAYGCNDTVVIGTVKNGTYTPVNDNDILGHRWISATLHVQKVVRGGGLPPDLPVRYFAHAYMRQDEEFMLVLKHDGTGYEITTGQLMRVRPLLADHCD